ncbi:unnamed protein product [Tilletia controversa]|nr:unnamed protein product [Tilletia controversa]CAD6919550.1 unnamed protein product [Tilletia controversa]CAD6948322.1 unnamed protein product [Tilletia controversa]CAD6974364.1 unnamed protein product [Tilletia controversa]
MASLSTATATAARSSARSLLSPARVGAVTAATASNSGACGSRWTSTSAPNAAQVSSTDLTPSKRERKSAETSSSSASTMSKSTSWQPALPSGLEPAYDAALAFLGQHKQAKVQAAEALRSKGQATQADKILVEGNVDDPQTRWLFSNGQVDLSLPVFRFLREQAWRKNGALDRLLERVRLMKVVPDVVPTIAPTVDVQVAYGEGQGFGDHGGNGGDVWPGVFLETAKTVETPRVTATTFHPEERKYTLLMVDPDVPDELSMSYGTFVHWQLTDIPLSATSSTISSELSTVSHSYLPPHPQKGSSYHRYTLLLLEQPAGSSPSALPSRSLTPDSIHAYIEAHGLKPVGIHFFRQVCDKKNEPVVESIYRDVFHLEAPVYGNMPKQDPFRDAAGFRRSRYFSSADELAAGH